MIHHPAHPDFGSPWAGICFKGESGTREVTENRSGLSAPWKKQQPYLLRGFEEAQRQFEGDKPQFFPGSTVVPFAPETEQALGGYTALANDPDSLINQASGQAGRTLRGDYLQPDNPVYQGMLQGVTRAVRPGVDASFASANRFGSPLHAQAMAEGVSQGMLPFLESERGRQEAAVLNAPRIGRAGSDLLGQVGGAREAQSATQLQEDIDRFNFEQNIDSAKLADYMRLISGNYGGESTGTISARQPLYSNPLMSGLSAATGLASIGSAAFGGPDGGGFLRDK